MQNVGIRLAYGMGYGAILDVASVDIKILTVRPAARVGGAGNDAPQGNQAVFQFGAKALFGEFDPQNVADAFRRIGGTPVFLRLVVVKQAKGNVGMRSEEHTSELQSLMRISYAVFCLKKK